jgi:hypothetical protein
MRSRLVGLGMLVDQGEALEAARTVVLLFSIYKLVGKSYLNKITIQFFF